MLPSYTKMSPNVGFPAQLLHFTSVPTFLPTFLCYSLSNKRLNIILSILFLPLTELACQLTSTRGSRKINKANLEAAVDYIYILNFPLTRFI